MGELRRAFRTQRVEEHLEGGVVAARAGPYESAAVMVNDDDQIPMSALVGDLVDPDAA